MAAQYVVFCGVSLDPEVARVLEMAGLGDVDVEDDLARVRDGRVTRAELLAQCLEGSAGSEDLDDAWREYVAAVFAEASRAWDE